MSARMRKEQELSAAQFSGSLLHIIYSAVDDKTDDDSDDSASRAHWPNNPMVPYGQTTCPEDQQKCCVSLE